MLLHEDTSGYLEGQLLIATPLITGSCFYRAVIYMCVHNDEGAMGLVVNHIIQNLSFRDVLKQLNFNQHSVHGNTPVHFGGPVDSARGFVLHSDDYATHDTVQMGNTIALTSSVDVLRDVAEGRGPSESLLALGYAGWAGGQLESEIEANSWISAPATPELVFGAENDEKWTRAAMLVGVDLLKLSTNVGHA